MVSSSSELSSLAPPKKTTSGELERCHSWWLESTLERSLSDSDSVELELLRVDALESEVCDLDRCSDLSTLWCGDWDLLGEYDGLHGVWCWGAPTCK